MCRALSHRNVTKIHMKLKQSMVEIELRAEWQKKLDFGVKWWFKFWLCCLSACGRS